MGSLGNCCCGCLIHKDSFDRTDGTPLRGSWCEEEGDYEIDSGTAKCVTPGALAILNIQHPEPDESMVVNITTVDEESITKYRILVNVVRTISGDPAVCEALDYYFAELEINYVTGAVIRLGICSNGVESIIKEDDVIGISNTTRVFNATISEKEFCASISNSVLSLVTAEHAGLFAGGYWSGFSIDSEDAKIDDFEFYQHHTTDVECGSCTCTCQENHFPPVLHVRVYPDPSDCIRLDLLEPCEFEIEYDRVDGAWVGSGLCCGGYGVEWEVKFNCSATDDPTEAGIVIIKGCTDSCYPCEYEVTAECDPICITFGPFAVSASDLGCFCSSVPFDINDPTSRGNCDYYIEVCE